MIFHFECTKIVSCLEVSILMDKDMHFSELAALWLKIMEPKVTYTWYNNLKNYVKQSNKYIGDKTITEIKPYDIDIIIENLAKRNPNTNKPASKKYLKSLVDCLKRIFNFAIENELTYKNPAKDKKKNVPKSAPVKEITALTQQQIQLVLDVEHRAKIAAVIMMFTGLRTGELLALEWNDIDFENKKIFVHQRAQRVESNLYQVIPRTKNGKNRYVSIPDFLIPWLLKQMRHSSSYLVCPNLDNNLQSPTQWKRLWESYQKAINYHCYVEICKRNTKKAYAYYAPTKIPIVVTKFNAHQLRHTYATLLYISGVDLLTMHKLLGHSNISTTLKIYTHLQEQYKELKILEFNEFVKSNYNIDNI